MNKKLLATITLSIFLVIALTSIVSAYGYYNEGYDRTTYLKTTTHSSPYGPSYTETTNYDKSTDTVYLGGNGYATTTSYIKTTTRSPDYSYSYFPSSYYGSYYPKSAYTYSYKPYYPYGWNTKPSYNYYTYGSGNKYGYDYYYQPAYIGHYNWRY